MSSSRWKRFAFFDRRNLSLPQPVIDDIFPPLFFPDSNSIALGSKRILVGSSRNNGGTYQEDVLDNGERVSLAVTNDAKIPLLSVSEGISSESNIGVKDMNANLLALKNTCYSPAENHDGLVQFSSSGQPLSIPKGETVKLRSSTTKNSNVEGSLMLAFVSSRAVENVHCVDLTVRCNPINHAVTGNESSTNNEALKSSDVESEGSMKNYELEDLDGWRGYFQPFVNDTEEETNIKPSNITTTTIGAIPVANVSSPSVSKSVSIARIVGIAISSDKEISSRKSQNIYVACITDLQNSFGVTVHRNPHLYLNEVSTLEVVNSNNVNSSMGNVSDSTAKLIVTPKAEIYQPVRRFDYNQRGNPSCVDISCNCGIVAVGTDTGMVLVYAFSVSINLNLMTVNNEMNQMNLVMEIQPPPTSLSGIFKVTSLTIVSESTCIEVGHKKKNVSNKPEKNVKIFVAYLCNNDSKEGTKVTKKTPKDAKSSVTNGGGGVCCYDLGVIENNTVPTNRSPSARYDLDGRDVSTSCLCDLVLSRRLGGEPDGDYSGGETDYFMVARSDGLYTYSSTDKISVSPIDGRKIAICSIPPQVEIRKRFYSRKLLESDVILSEGNNTNSSTVENENSIKNLQTLESGASYVLVATTDLKSGRDAVDIYDAMNKLVAFHLLLSPGHKTLRVAGVTTLPMTIRDGSTRGGLSSAVVLTSGGSIVTLTEKVTSAKVSLLVQKNLYSAAISMAFADQSYQPSDITNLYRRHAEHLYRKGDFSAAMNQYIYTIGSLEPSHVIFRYLDAPKIPLLVAYLEELRSREFATPVQNELLRTCYLKLNDTGAAEKVSSSLSNSLDSSSCISLVSKLFHNPTEALTTICLFNAPQAAEALTLYGDTFARALPRETAGVVISLCDGTYSPTSLANVTDVSTSPETKGNGDIFKKQLDSDGLQPTMCEIYPVAFFSSAFLENPKLLRVILAHCYKNKRELSQSLKRTLLELTLEEWNNSRRSVDKELESKRRAEAISILSDPLSINLGNYEALVIVQLAGFDEGEVMLYERLQMTPMLVEKYAKDGTYRARRQMLSMCRSDPELLADVLGNFVAMTSVKGVHDGKHDESELGEIFDDIREALSLARAQGVLPPVRIARILAGDGVGQFSNERSRKGQNMKDNCVPLSVALDYIGDILDESSKEIDRLKNDVEEYSEMCCSVEAEISALRLSPSAEGGVNDRNQSNLQELSIEDMYSTLMQGSHDNVDERRTELSSEEFWREMGLSEDRFETIARFFAKGIID